MAVPGESPRQGWYLDPEDPTFLRWWDGAQWTSHRRPTPSSDPALPAPPLAGFWRRAAASVIDWLVTAVLMSPLLVLVVVVAVWVLSPYVRPGSPGNPDELDPSVFAGAYAIFLSVWLLAAVVPAAYAVLFEGGPYGQTIGKWLMRIVVRRPDPPARLGYGRAFGRWAVKAIASGFLFLGYLWMLWDDGNRTWHDLAVDSRVVVSAERPRFGELIRGSLRRRLAAPSGPARV